MFSESSVRCFLYSFCLLTACKCNVTGSLGPSCSKLGGFCECKPNVIGRCCDTCAPLTFGFGPDGCKRKELSQPSSQKTSEMMQRGEADDDNSAVWDEWIFLCCFICSMWVWPSRFGVTAVRSGQRSVCVSFRDKRSTLWSLSDRILGFPALSTLWMQQTVRGVWSRDRTVSELQGPLHWTKLWQVIYIHIYRCVTLDHTVKSYMFHNVLMFYKLKEFPHEQSAGDGGEREKEIEREGEMYSNANNNYVAVHVERGHSSRCSYDAQSRCSLDPLEHVRGLQGRSLVINMHQREINAYRLRSRGGEGNKTGSPLRV